MSIFGNRGTAAGRRRQKRHFRRELPRLRRNGSRLLLPTSLMKAKDRDYKLEENISKAMVKVSREYNMEMLRRVK